MPWISGIKKKKVANPLEFLLYIVIAQSLDDIDRIKRGKMPYGMIHNNISDKAHQQKLAVVYNDAVEFLKKG